jgi:hypothetical protein
MITLTPAYGRDYKNRREVLAAYVAGKDFIVNDVSNRYHGLPANNADLKGLGNVKFRYGNLNRVFVYNA